MAEAAADQPAAAASAQAVDSTSVSANGTAPVIAASGGEERHAAAVKLQAMSRGKSSRKLNMALPAADVALAPVASTLPEASLDGGTEEARQAAAIKLQAVSRGRSCRNLQTSTPANEAEPSGGNSAAEAGPESDLWAGMGRNTGRQTRRVSFGTPDAVPSDAPPKGSQKEATDPSTPPLDETPSGRVRLPQKGGFVIRTPRLRKALLGEEGAKGDVTLVLDNGTEAETEAADVAKHAVGPVEGLGAGGGTIDMRSACAITFKDASATKKELAEKEAEAAEESLRAQESKRGKEAPPLPPGANGMRPSRRRSACAACVWPAFEFATRGGLVGTRDRLLTSTLPGSPSALSL